MKVRRIDFAPDEWIAEAIAQKHLIVAIGDGLGDWKYTRSEMQELRSLVLERDNYECRYCGGPANSLDHVLPRARGGLTTEHNLVAACRSCNSRKGARL
jgi:5-methylcytosine-specific restriction endonuclease McrA